MVVPKHTSVLFLEVNRKSQSQKLFPFVKMEEIHGGTHTNFYFVHGSKQEVTNIKVVPLYKNGENTWRYPYTLYHYSYITQIFLC